MNSARQSPSGRKNLPRVNQDATEPPDESVISAITPAELSGGPPVAHDDAERSARQHLEHIAIRMTPLMEVPLATIGG